MSQVVLKKLVKVYPNGFEAVHGIDLQINEGEFMVLVGPSGCAKSTVLRMIAGIEDISGGEIKIGDRVVNYVAPKNRGISMVFQDYALFPHMSVFDNIAISLKSKKLSKKEINERVTAAANMLEIGGVLQRIPGTLSGGQKQRVAVARSVAKKPDVMLFDEPLSNLDAKLRNSVRCQIAKLHNELKSNGQSATMIYVTHDQIEAMTLGDRICVLKDGCIMQVDTPMNLYKFPNNKFVAGFIGSPTMNFIDGTLEGKKIVSVLLAHDNYRIMLPLWKSHCVSKNLSKAENSKVCLGIRPEDIAISEVNSANIDLPFVKGRVKLLENMGNELFCYFSIDGNETLYVAKQPANHLEVAIKEGSEYKFHINMPKCHVFSRKTEENISL